MTKEQLLAAGFTEEQATNILKMHKEALDGNYVAKHRFDEVNRELKSVKEQVSERDNQIAELKKFEGDAKSLQDKITELEKANSQKDKEYKDKLVLERKKNAVKLALLEDGDGKPHDPDMVLGLFNLEQITINEESGKIEKGLKEQLDPLRKEKSFLFEAKQQQKQQAGWKPAGSTPPDGDDKGGTGQDASAAFGKSLAQIKLGMMGVQPTGNNAGQ